MPLGIVFQQFQMADFQRTMQVLAILIKLPFIGLQQFFMLIGGVNFSLHISAFLALGKRNIWRNYWKDPEFRFFF